MLFKREEFQYLDGCPHRMEMNQLMKDFRKLNWRLFWHWSLCKIYIEGTNMTLFSESQLPETGSVKLLVGGRSRDEEHESSNCEMHISYQSCLRLLRPRPNVELFMRRTKLSEFKVHESSTSTSGSVWIVHMNMFYRRIERLKIVFGTNFDLYMRCDELNWWIKNLYDDVYI